MEPTSSESPHKKRLSFSEESCPRSRYWVAFEGIPVKYYGHRLAHSVRNCTDLPCLAIFVLAVIAWVWLARYAILNGDFDELTAPRDSYGFKCGVEKGPWKKIDLRQRPNVMFFDMMDCVDINVLFFGCESKYLCREQCPNRTFEFNNRYCELVENTTVDHKSICMYPRADFFLGQIWMCKSFETELEWGFCAPRYLPSRPFFNRCLPLDHTSRVNSDPVVMPHIADREIAFARNLRELKRIGMRINDDLMETGFVIVAFVMLGVFLCTYLLSVLRRIAKVFVWLSIFTAIFVSGCGVIHCNGEYDRVYNLKEPPKPIDIKLLNVTEWTTSITDSTSTWLCLGVLSGVICFAIIGVVIVVRQRIVLVIALVKESSKAITSSTIIFSMLPWVVSKALIPFAIYITLNLKSIEWSDRTLVSFNNETATTTFATMHSWHLYNIFGAFWILLFVSATIRMTVAMTITTWYWSFNKRNASINPLTVASDRVMRYHMGTMAFGSLTIGICSYFRFLTVPVDAITNKLDNSLTRILVYWFGWMAWLNELCFGFLNNSAYIMCAMHGKPLIPSARIAFDRLTRNLLYAVAVDKIIDFVIFTIRAMVTTIVGAAAYYFFAFQSSTYPLNYVAVPVSITMITTYWITGITLGVYKIAVDTMFLCFLDDCERNDGSRKNPYFMSTDLMKTIGKSNIKYRKPSLGKVDSVLLNAM